MKHFLFKLTFYANFAQTVFMYDLIKQIKWIDQVIEKQLQIVRNELNHYNLYGGEINLSKLAPK